MTKTQTHKHFKKYFKITSKESENDSKTKTNT